MARGDGNGKIGRPPKPIDPQLLLRFLQVYPTKKQTATFFDCSEDHIENEIDRQFECSFSALRERQIDGIKRDLMSWCLRYAKSGNHNLIMFAMKNINGWSDKPETEQNNSQVIELKYSIGNKGKNDEGDNNGQKQLTSRNGGAKEKKD
jgi:hypothetical protein